MLFRSAPSSCFCKVESCQKQLEGAPSILDCLCDACAAHFEGLKANLDALGIPYSVDPRIVRGLDYYTRTVFEIARQTENGTQAVCGGGRYDGLVEQIGGPKLPAMGFGMGVERVLMLLEQSGVEIPEPRHYDAYVAALGAQARIPALKLTTGLRRAGVKTETDHAGRSLKAQFKHADKVGAPYILIVGGDELARGTVRLRNMQTKEETEIPLENAVEYMKERI